mmetsp:Transcript_22736/g.57729  ORF Transcript_22736/g.57729 Transcript_22736/m.57729 type:complete len:205 (-) Transcript_22736:66-680(-)
MHAYRKMNTGMHNPYADGSSSATSKPSSMSASTSCATRVLMARKPPWTVLVMRSVSSRYRTSNEPNGTWPERGPRSSMGPPAWPKTILGTMSMPSTARSTRRGAEGEAEPFRTTRCSRRSASGSKGNLKGSESNGTELRIDGGFHSITFAMVFASPSNTWPMRTNSASGLYPSARRSGLSVYWSDHVPTRDGWLASHSAQSTPE